MIFIFARDERVKAILTQIALGDNGATDYIHI